MLKRVFSSIFLILFRPPDTVLAFIFLVLLWSVGNSMSPGRSGIEKRLPFFSWILGMWGPPFFFSCTILLRSSLKTRSMEEQRREDSSPSKLMSTNKWIVRCVYKSLSLLTKYVGFDGQREVCVISKDVNSFGDGDVLKVLTIDLHDLKQDGGNGKMIAELNVDVRICLELVNTYWISVKKLSVNLERIRCILVCLCIILDFLDSAYLSDIIQLLYKWHKKGSGQCSVTAG